MRIINHALHEDYRLPNEMVCPTCKCKMDAACAWNGNRRPNDGDYSVCAGCGEILLYSVKDGTYALRLALEDDLLYAVQHGLMADILEAQKYIRATNHGLKVVK